MKKYTTMMSDFIKRYQELQDQVIYEEIKAEVAADELFHKLSIIKKTIQHNRTLEEDLKNNLEKEIIRLEKEIYFSLLVTEKEKYELLRKIIVNNPIFKINYNKNIYICTPSLRNQGYQISALFKKNESLIAIGDRQCPCIDDVIDYIQDFGLDTLLLTNQFSKPPKEMKSL